MAFFTGNIQSEALAMQTALRVILPESGMGGKKILYLLHGLSDDASVWTRRTSVELFAEAHGYAVIMPEVHRSFYMDYARGGQYFTYVTKELPALCEKLFGFRHTRETTFVAGLSMGGYGALKCALRHPEQYAACASFSGAVDLQRLVNSGEFEARLPEFETLLGAGGRVKESDDLMKLSVQTNSLAPDKKPRILTTCGLSDFLYKDNTAFRDHMRSLTFDYHYKEWSGDHSWPFWNTSIQYALDFFDGKPLAD